MARKITIVRIYQEDLDTFRNIGYKMQEDISKITGKKVRISMPMIFKAISPQFNENYISVNLENFFNSMRKEGRKK